MIHWHQELDTGPDDVVEVILGGNANVMLLDPENYERYQRGEDFRYHGGFADRSPFQLFPPYPGRWHVAVDLGGYPGRIRAGVQVYQRAGVGS
jgi:hypothetical protein